MSAVACVAVVLLVGCSDSGDSAGQLSTPRRQEATTTVQPTSSLPQSASSTTQPSASDPAGVRPSLQALIERYDAAVAAILADPRVASDSANEKVVTYLALFTPANSFPTGALKAWVQEGVQGHFYRPGPRGQMTTSTVVAVNPSSSDETGFDVCSVNSFVITDANGVVTGSQGGASAGRAVARRVGGQWVLRDLTQIPPTACPQPGAGG
jgi:hypothetical protein